ncbi:MAG: EF-hand domain-containing protein [FCB group bacterium]|nr:EF-hand domain-containing protein [FCB group bacterium]
MISGIQGNMNVSADMMAQMRDKMFARTDANGDGQINKAEMEDFAAHMAERTGKSMNVDDIIAAADSDGDGLISKTEFGAMRPPKPPANLASMFTYQPNAQTESADDMTGVLLDLLS